MKEPNIPHATQRAVASQKHKYKTVLSEKNITRSGKLIELTHERMSKAHQLCQRSRQLRDRSVKQIETAKNYRDTAGSLGAELSTRRKAG